MAFIAVSPSSFEFKFDHQTDPAIPAVGPTPLEAFLGSIAACTAMDVISILHKMHQTVTSYRVEIDGDRPGEGEYPRPYKSLKIRHILGGSNLDEALVQKAVELSENKYCSAMATLRECPTVATEWLLTQE